jgi:hypothetical protein
LAQAQLELTVTVALRLPTSGHNFVRDLVAAVLFAFVKQVTTRKDTTK